jgi:hypothetical protein
VRSAARLRTGLGSPLTLLLNIALRLLNDLPQSWPLFKDPGSTLFLLPPCYHHRLIRGYFLSSARLTTLTALTAADC